MQAALLEVSRQTVGDLERRGGGDEQRGAHGQRRGAGQQELDRVARVLDAAHADERDAGVAGDRAIDAMDVAKGQRPGRAVRQKDTAPLVADWVFAVDAPAGAA